MEKIIKTILVALLVSFVGTTPALTLAQEEIIVSTDGEEIVADENITAENLGVSEPRLLPDSPFYFFKDFWRSVRSTFTFNNVKKVELNLRYANEKLIEAKKLTERTQNEETLQNAFRDYQQEMEKIRERAENFKESAADNPKIDQFLDTLTDRTVKQQRLISNLEKKLSDKPEVLERIQEAKEKALENFGRVIEKLEENKEKIAERLEENLEKIEGTKYKNFKNLEVLIELEEKVPEPAKEAIKKAQENSLKRLNDSLEQMSSGGREKFSDYLEKVSGNQNTHLQILERLKEKTTSSTLRREIEQNRERTEEKIESLEKDRLRFQEKIQERIKEQTREGKEAEEEENEEVGEAEQEKNQERACVALWNPVCGADGKTYSNGCFAKLAGVEIAAKGQCKETAPEMESKSGR